MHLLKKLFLLVLLGLGTSPLYGENPDGKSNFQQELEENDENLLNFINAKRNIPLAKKSKQLTISGEIHTEWNYQTESIDGENIRVYTFRQLEDWSDTIYKPGDRIAIGKNDFDMQFDLFVDWRTDRTWARAHLRYDNSSGVSDNGIKQQIDPAGYHGSGSWDNLALREAFVGYEVFKCGDQRLVIELGRRGNLYKVLYSEIQFASRLDGIVVKYSNTKKNRFMDDWYVEWVGFVVDERADQFAWAMEMGANNLFNSGVDIKYSYIDWKKRGRNRYFIHNPRGFRFKVSQISLFYTLQPDWIGKHGVDISAGFLMNHVPIHYTFINRFGKDSAKYEGKKVCIGTQNLGGFVNLQYRTIEREGDWFVAALLGYCEAMCMPDNEVRNIGTGNFLKESMTAYGRGNTNWQGYALRAGCAITDNLALETQYMRSWNIKDIDGTQGYTRYTLETVYSF